MRDLDPYTPPREDSDHPDHVFKAPGRPCPACGSRNTGQGVLSRQQADLVYLLFFGWLYLTKIAFSRRTDTCRDCGSLFRYMTTAAWIALALVILFVLIALLALR